MAAKPKAARKTRALNAKQARFVQEYLVDLNATQASVRAGYSRKTAYSIGHDLLKVPEVETAIAVAMRERGERTKVTADRVLEELGYIALSDLGDVLASRVLPNGRVVVTIRSLDDLTPAARRCIKSIKQTTEEIRSVVNGGETEGEPTVVEKVVLQVELHPKVQALDLLMEHHGLKKPQKVELTGSVEVASAKVALKDKLDGLRKRTTAEPGGDAGTRPEGAG